MNDEQFSQFINEADHNEYLKNFYKDWIDDVMRENLKLKQENTELRALVDSIKIVMRNDNRLDTIDELLNR